MSGYKPPKTQLHREFVYLNYDTIINSLSAFEAGAIDEIIEKVTESREGGVEGSLGYGPAKVGGSKKKTANVEEELRRSRTNFSAFEAWQTHMDKESAFGELESWDLETRDEISVGDTIRFKARLRLTPVQQLFRTFIDFASQAGNPDSIFKQPAAQLADTKRNAHMMESWLGGKPGDRSVTVWIQPLGERDPRVSARLDERYLVGGVELLEGDFSVIAQVESLIAIGDAIPAIRVIRETPPTPMETGVITDAMRAFIKPAAELGVEITDDDLTLVHPGVIVHPIAIYR